MMLKDNSKVESPFITLVALWIETKKEAVATGDWSKYKEVLTEAKKSLSLLYAHGREEWYLEALERMIIIASCELKEINIKYKDNNIPF